jgi:DNA helicase MCM9
MQVNAEVLSPPDRDSKEYVLQFCVFLRDRRMLAKIEAMLLQGAGVLAHGHGAVEVSFMDLHDHSPQLALLLVYYPDEMMSLFEEALSRVQVEVAGHAVFAAKHGLVMTGPKPHEAFTKAHVHIRLVCLPPTLRVSKPSISDIRPDDPGCLFQFSGTVVRTGAVVMFDVSRDYKCSKRSCNNDLPFTVRADLEQGNTLPVPQACPFCEAKHPREVEGSRVCVDYQEIKVQDQIERVAFGTMPRSVVVLLEADLVDRVNAGDDVTVVGSKPFQQRGNRGVILRLREHHLYHQHINDNFAWRGQRARVPGTPAHARRLPS